MSKITLDQINKELELFGWSCLDSEYKNLQTPMTFKCNEGHIVETTWGKLRNKRVCPVCVSNVKKKITNIAAVPKTGEYRILALDQSSHRTGYSIYDGKALISYGVFESTKVDPLDRIVDLCAWLDNMIANWQPDEVGMEETQYQPNAIGHDVFKLLSQVMGALMITAARAKCKVNTVLIATWRHHCGVKGRYRADQKRSAQMLVKQWHDITVSDDESDAICIGKYFADTHMEVEKQVIGDLDF